MFVVALLCVMVVAGHRARLGSRSANVALALFGAFAAWNLLSILWAGSRASALEAGGEPLPHPAAAWGIAPPPRRRRAAGAAPRPRAPRVGGPAAGLPRAPPGP